MAKSKTLTSNGELQFRSIILLQQVSTRGSFAVFSYSKFGGSFQSEKVPAKTLAFFSILS